VVPDVSGIDKIFDYLVPDSLVGKVSPGVRVRVVLNNRRVSGWVVKLETRADTTADGLSFDKLSSVVSVSGLGVEADGVALTHWAADEFFGSWRSMLSRASAPRVRERMTHATRSVPQPMNDPVAAGATALADSGGGLLVIPPCASALSAVQALACRGPVLVVCPTQRMAILGAASLRRRGLTTAVAPDDWDAARSGVNVVIGARSAVFAPCRDMASIVVIDEHDELHHDERAPTWNSVAVAQERARRLGVPCVLTSAVPSAESLVRHGDSMIAPTTLSGWPEFVIENLNEVPVAQSLLSSSLLEAVAESRGTTVCVLNTKGRARLVVCKSCRALQVCIDCSAALTLDDDDRLHCDKCDAERGMVCVACGRTAFSVPRGGVSHLVSQVQKSTGRTVVEVTAETDDSWATGSVFIGTEAVLFRIPQAETVVFADIDRDLNAPRLTAAREVASLMIRAARIVGSGGRVVVQTRTPDHPLLRAISLGTVESLLAWNRADVATRESFMFPPFGVLARVSLVEGRSFDELPDISPVKIAIRGDDALISAVSRDAIRDALAIVRQIYGTSVRVYADPTRY
jgi:primosomal protein N' (replication factor Y) (superfamily II helicase)